MTCAHGIEYPCDGPNPAVGPWSCNPDGSNPACADCGPDDWAKTLTRWVEPAPTTERRD